MVLLVEGQSGGYSLREYVMKGSQHMGRTLMTVTSLGLTCLSDTQLYTTK